MFLFHVCNLDNAEFCYKFGSLILVDTSVTLMTNKY